MWISVEDRLPDDEAYYLAYFSHDLPSGAPYRWSEVVYFRGKSFQTDVREHITHWQPLPEPPEST